MAPMTTSSRVDWAPLALLALLLLVWEFGPRLYGSRDVPPFSTVLASLITHGPEISREVAHTLRRALIGFALALVTMLPLGILIGRIRVLGELLEPIIDLLRPLPPLAIVPVVMLFAGIGDAAKISVIIFAAAFPILIHAIDGVRGIHPMHALVSRALRLSRLEALWHIDIRAVLPVVMTGIRLAIANALLVAVTTEMLMSSDGIGLFILKAQEGFRIADGMAGILVVAVLGWCVNRLLQVADRRLLAWHYATTGEAK